MHLQHPHATCGETLGRQGRRKQFPVGGQEQNFHTVHTTRMPPMTQNFINTVDGLRALQRLDQVSPPASKERHRVPEHSFLRKVQEPDQHSLQVRLGAFDVVETSHP